MSIEATELVDLWPRAQGVGGGAGVTLVLGQDLEPCGSKSTLNKGGTRKGLGPGEKGYLPFLMCVCTYAHSHSHSYAPCKCSRVSWQGKLFFLAWL